jgi:tetratricopeptide (TPR) repeat protein
MSDFFYAICNKCSRSGTFIKKYIGAHPLVFIIGIGFLLRIYRLPYQSLWLDEWLPHTAMSAGQLSRYLSIFKIVIPEHTSTPAFYVALYLWSKIVGLDPLLLRIFPVLIGCASIALIYFWGSVLFSRRTGITAAFFLALSPTQIWYSQELRPYGLMLFLALCSVFTLEYALASARKNTRWWVLYYSATALFIFNHLFSILILIPQGIYIYLRRDFRSFFFWTLPYVLIAALLVFSALNVSHVSVDHTSPAPCPQLTETLALILGKDVISSHSDMLPVWLANPAAILPTRLQVLLKLRPLMDVLFFLFLIAGLLLLPARYFVLKKKTCQTCKTQSGSKEDKPAPATLPQSGRPEQIFSKIALLLMLAFFPTTILAFIQGVTRLPFTGPGYDAYNVVGIYIAVAFVISTFEKKRLYNIFLLLIALLCGYQCLIFLPYRTRPDWKAAAAHIRQNCRSGDLILDEWSIGPLSRTHTYLNDLPVQHAQATSFGDVCSQAVSFLKHQEKNEKNQSSVWILTEPLFLSYFIHSRYSPLQTLENALEECGLEVACISFPGGSDISVLKATRSDSQEPHFTSPYIHALYTEDYEQVFSDFEISVQTEQEKEFLIAGLQKSQTFWPIVYTQANIQLGFSFLRNKEYRLAGAFARYLLRSHPYYGLGYYCMGTLLALAGEKERAQAYFTQAFSLYPVVESYSGSFSRELCQPGNTLPGKSASDRLSAFPYQFFVDLERYINETAIPFGDGSGNRMLPESEIGKLAAELSEGKVIIEALFSAQDSLATTEGWLPITKRLPAFWAEALCLFTGDAENTANKYRALIARYPFERMFYERYDFYLKQYTNGSEYAEKWLDLVSVNPDLAAYAIKKLEETGQFRLQHDQEEDALAAFERALSLGSDSISTAAKAGDLHARSYRWQEALNAYAIVLKKEPYYENVLDKADEILNRLNDARITQTYWKDIQASNSTQWEVVRRYCAVLENEKRYDEATAIYLSIRDSAEHGCDALLAGARCLRLASNAQQAFHILNMQDPKRCHPPKLLSYEYILSGQQLTEEQLFTDAIHSFLKATEVGGFDELAYFGLGSIALQRGDTESALDYFKKSVDADPENTWHRQCLAVEQQKAGRYQEALENLKILLEKSPDNEGLRQNVLSLVQEHRDMLREDTVQDLFTSFPDWFSLPPADN